MEYHIINTVHITEIIDNYIQDLSTETIYVVVICANNGEIDDFLVDHLNKNNVVGVLVEPVKSLFKQLKKKFSKFKNLSFQNSAIDTISESKPFYSLSHSYGLPDWAKGLGSLNKKTLLTHDNQIGNIKDLVREESLDCITFDELMTLHPFPKVNILQIDTEGHDYEILKSIDVLKYRPEIIIIEFLHITTYEYYAAIDFLKKRNYYTAKNFDSFDMVAIDRRIL
jgi:FkbM family methyltransferase